MKKKKEIDDRLKNYECDGQLCFVDIDMKIEEESKKETNHNLKRA